MTLYTRTCTHAQRLLTCKVSLKLCMNYMETSEYSWRDREIERDYKALRETLLTHFSVCVRVGLAVPTTRQGMEWTIQNVGKYAVHS